MHFKIRQNSLFVIFCPKNSHKTCQKVGTMLASADAIPFFNGAINNVNRFLNGLIFGVIMKFMMMVLTAATMISSAAFAASPTDSWSSLRNNRDVLILQPHAVMSMGPTGVFNTCATDEELRSINPVRTCTAYKTVVRGNPNSEAGGWIEYVCTNYVMKDVVVTRDHEETICVKHAPVSETSSGECIESATVNRTYPRDFKLEVVGGTGEVYMRHLFDKAFSLPDCE